MPAGLLLFRAAALLHSSTALHSPALQASRFPTSTCAPAAPPRPPGAAACQRSAACLWSLLTWRGETGGMAVAVPACWAAARRRVCRGAPSFSQSNASLTRCRITGHAPFESRPLAVHDRLAAAHRSNGGLVGQFLDPQTGLEHARGRVVTLGQLSGGRGEERHVRAGSEVLLLAAARVAAPSPRLLTLQSALSSSSLFCRRPQ